MNENQETENLEIKVTTGVRGRKDGSLTLIQEGQEPVLIEMPKMRYPRNINSVVVPKVVDGRKWGKGAIVVGTMGCCDGFVLQYSLESGGDSSELTPKLEAIYNTVNVSDMLPIEVNARQLSMLVVGYGCTYTGAQLIKACRVVDILDLYKDPGGEHGMPPRAFKTIEVDPEAKTGDLIKMILEDDGYPQTSMSREYEPLFTSADAFLLGKNVIPEKAVNVSLGYIRKTVHLGDVESEDGLTYSINTRIAKGQKILPDK